MKHPIVKIALGIALAAASAGGWLIASDADNWWLKLAAGGIAVLAIASVCWGYATALTLAPSGTRQRAFAIAGAGLVTMVIAVIGVPDSFDDQLAAVSWNAVFVGGLLVMGWGLVGVVPRPHSSGVMLENLPGVGYRFYVAWRYLLDARHDVSLRTRVMLIGLTAVEVWLGLIAGTDTPRTVMAVVVAIALLVVIFHGVLRFSPLARYVLVFGLVVLANRFAFGRVIVEGLLDGPSAERVLDALPWVALGAAILAGLAIFIGTLRAVFTFFTTVPIVGVWIGTLALVVVLAVMSGFETDLRQKIVGSNAHLQVSKIEGEFVDWREVKTKLDRLPGVVASTPFASSEVVIAADGNGMNVIVKGIDPQTIGAVTNLVANLEDEFGQKDPRAIDDLEPKRDDGIDPRITPPPPRDPNAIDPAPPDLPQSGDPIDFSGGNVPSDGGVDPNADADAGVNADASTGAAGGPDLEPPAHVEGGRSGNPAHFGGDAVDVVGAFNQGAFDSPLLRWLVGDHDDDEDFAPQIIVAKDLQFELPSRTRVLPGILIGRELYKQNHYGRGREVRLVSPLADPSNPDATGTPIPFNRDYRVAGIFYSGMYEYDLKFVYVTLDSLQNFLDLGDSVDGIEVRLESADDTDRYLDGPDGPGLISQAIGPGYRVQDWRELNRSLFSALKLEKILMFVVLSIVILVAAFAIIGNLIMVVVEKSREIALLKTLGASDGGVMSIFAVQGLIIGVIGTTLGVAGGLATCWALDRFGLPLNPDVYYINRLPIHVDPESVVLAGCVGILISMLATLYPALLGAWIRPAVGLRQ